MPPDDPATTAISAANGLVDLGFGLFGSGGSTSGRSSGSSTGVAGGQTNITNRTGTISEGSVTGTESEQLELNPMAVLGIIQNVLGGSQGLASVFQGEQTAGIYNSTVAAQAAGDLASKLVAEIAQITGKKTKKKDEATGENTQSLSRQQQRQHQIQTSDFSSTSKQDKEEKGVLESVGDFFGF